MIVGMENGNLIYFQNNSVGVTPSFDPPIFDVTDDSGNIIHHGLYAAPQLFDLNNDGLLETSMIEALGRKVWL